MAIYILVAILIAILSYRPQSKLGLLVCFVLLFLVSAFRGLDVGTDVMGVYYWQYVNHTPVRLIEYGWYFFRELFSLFLPYRAFIIAVSLLLLLPLFLFAWKCGKTAILVILFYLLLYNFCYSLNTMRQLVAISLVLLATLYLKGEKKWLFYVLVIVASTIHTSALIMLVLPLLEKININNWIVIALLVASYLFGLFNEEVFKGIDFTNYEDTYLNYFSQPFMRDVEFSWTRLMLNFVLIILLFTTDNSSLSLKLFIIGAVILNLFPAFPDSGRIAKYFLVFQAPLFAMLKFNKDIKFETQMMVKGVVWIYSVSVFLYLLNANVGGVVPYSFAW